MWLQRLNLGYVANATIINNFNFAYIDCHNWSFQNTASSLLNSCSIALLISILLLGNLPMISVCETYLVVFVNCIIIAVYKFTNLFHEFFLIPRFIILVINLIKTKFLVTAKKYLWRSFVVFLLTYNL